jgi:hypothetical protein
LWHLPWTRRRGLETLCLNSLPLKINDFEVELKDDRKDVHDVVEIKDTNVKDVIKKALFIVSLKSNSTRM